MAERTSRRATGVAAAYWSAASSGRFFTWWSAAASFAVSLSGNILGATVATAALIVIDVAANAVLRTLPERVRPPAFVVVWLVAPHDRSGRRPPRVRPQLGGSALGVGLPSLFSGPLDSVSLAGRFGPGIPMP